MKECTIKINKFLIYEHKQNFQNKIQSLTVQIVQYMGVKQSVHIDTPDINLNQWDYIAQQSQIPEQYGIFRTLRNKKTGEKIDEYDFIWPNEDQYNYYLKSFNWRYKQPNVVNTKFILLNSQDQFCSHSYMAKIYIEHIKIRISEISDIPYPDNLYVLMESLEGYNKIYQHAKYFFIEESQICVDDFGNVKIWVNSDLSINYPNNEGYIQSKQKGQEDMVDNIINIIAENTDIQTQPSPTFKDYYEQKKGAKGIKFEQAKVLVLNYARLNQIQIPNRFEAIIIMENEEQMELKSFTDNGKSYQYIPSKQDQNYYEGSIRNNRQFSHHTFTSPPIQAYSFGPNNFPLFAQNRQSIPYSQSISQQHITYQQPAYPHQAGQVYYIPQYTRVQYPKQIGAPINQQYLSINSQLAPVTYQKHPEIKISSNEQSIPSKPQKKQPNHFYDIRGTVVSQLNDDLSHNEDEDDLKQQNSYINENIQEDQDTENNQNSNNREEEHYISQADDLVARSLPIKAGYPSKNTQPLSSMGQSERAIYSHINPKDQWQGNIDGFGLTKNSQLKLKDSTLSANKNNLPNPVKSKIEVKPIKYFYSLDQQFQIDPVIAADMAKYLS